jgi:hypothetical protein
MDINEFLGPHPTPEDFGCHTESVDGYTDSDVPHRALTQNSESYENTISQLRYALVRHHVSPEMVERDRRKRENLQRLGYTQLWMGTVMKICVSYFKTPFRPRTA